MMMKKRRVAVTGAGLVTPAGLGLDRNWDRIINGQTAITPIGQFDVSHFPFKLGGTVLGFNGADYIKNKRNLRFIRKDVQYCLAGVKMALDAGRVLESGADPADMGLYVGSGESEVHYDSFFTAMERSMDERGSIDPKKFGLFGMHALYPSFLLVDLANNGFCYASIEHGIMGPNNNISGSASGGLALGEAFKAVQYGETAIAVAGGHDSLISCFENYYLYTATGWVTRETDPARSMKPFSRVRDGFVLAEGSGFAVLEEWERAVARNAPILGEIVGFGSNCDSGPDLFHPGIDGESLVRVLDTALSDAGIDSARIDYINADGLATYEHDIAETKAYKRFFGEGIRRIPVSSVKPVIGYTGAAAAPIDFIVTLMALRHQIVPPTVNFSGGDPKCDLDYVGGRFRPHPMEYAVSLNQGMGGQNCAFVVRINK